MLLWTAQMDSLECWAMIGPLFLKSIPAYMIVYLEGMFSVNFVSFSWILSAFSSFSVFCTHIEFMTEQRIILYIFENGDGLRHIFLLRKCPFLR